MSEELQRLHYPGFPGRVGRIFGTSEPSWPAQTIAPERAPNIVFVLADDLGFSDLGCFGSEIPTPAIDSLAARGVRFTNFHVSPLCSPTRAALLTGLNSHAAGFGYVANVDPGYPGYSSELPRNQPSVAEMLRDSGYSTLAVGKWHLCKDSDLSEAADRHSWPLQRGFEQYYGFLEALTNFHHPHRMYEGNSVVQVDQYPEDYYLTDDLTDRAIRMIREVKSANPAKPFFLYFSHGAVHAPLQAKQVDIVRHRGRYAKGWDALRAERLARQIELGVMPEGTQLPPRNSELNEDVQAWDSLPDNEKIMFARYMEVYAAMVESIDQSMARLVDTLRELGELDNTIIMFTSDNGASREGRDGGMISYFSQSGHSVYNCPPVTDEDLARLDEVGGPTTWPHYPRGWAMACNTPFRLYKITTHRGGHSVPLVVSWPARLSSHGTFRHQYTHATDLLPTLAEIVGIAVPSTRHGEPAAPVHGSSFVAALFDSEAQSKHTEQYYECTGHRAYYRDGWEAVAFHESRTPFSGDHWELFDVANDINQLNDLSGKFPDKVDELKRAWEHAAWENRVFPLDEGTQLYRHLRPTYDAPFSEPVRIVPGTPTLERYRSSRLIAGRDFLITVSLDFHRGDEGILLAHGGQEAGYVLWIEDDQLHFELNANGIPCPFSPAKLKGAVRSIEIDVRAPGNRRWDIAVRVDGHTVMERQELRQLVGFLPFEGIDVGIDRRSPVSWSLYQRRGCFPYRGTLHSVTYTPGSFAPDGGAALVAQLRELSLGLE